MSVTDQQRATAGWWAVTPKMRAIIIATRVSLAVLVVVLIAVATNAGSDIVEKWW